MASFLVSKHKKRSPGNRSRRGLNLAFLLFYGHQRRGIALRVLARKPLFQPFHAPIFLKLPQRAGAELCPGTVVQIPQARPKLRVMVPQLPQLVYALKGTAPAGRPVINTVQPAKVKAPVIANLQGLGLRDPPFHKGVLFALVEWGITEAIPT